MKNETEHTCQFCFYECFNSRAYPCSMCICGEERKDMFMPKSRRNERKTEQTERPCDNCQEFDCYDCEHKRTEREDE